MTRFHEQMKKVRNDVEDYYDVSSNDDWTIQDYRDFFWCVEEDYLVQAWDRKNSFMINEEWEGEDVYAIEFLEEEEERTEFEVEYGYMIDEETHGKSFSEGYDDEKDAKEYYDMLVSNKEYDYVWLVMRHMEGEDCMCSETIEEWKK